MLARLTTGIIYCQFNWLRFFSMGWLVHHLAPTKWWVGDNWPDLAGIRQIDCLERAKARTKANACG